MLVYAFVVVFVAMYLALSPSSMSLLQLHICISCRSCLISQEHCGPCFLSPSSPFG